MNMPQVTVKINSDLITHESRSQDPGARSTTAIEEVAGALEEFFKDVWNKNVDLKGKTVVVAITLEDRNDADFQIR